MKTYTNSEIDKHIGFVARDAGKLQVKIHALGVSILKVWHDAPAKERAEQCELAVKRINALEGASPYHAKAFNKWVNMTCPFIWNGEESFWVSDETHTRLMGKEFIAARDLPFWKVSPPSAPKPMNVYDMIERIIDQQNKHTKKPVEDDVIDVSLNNKLRELLKDRPVGA